MLLSIVLSFRNEAEGLEELITRIRAAIEPLDIEHEMIFVNDDSTDASLELLKKFNKEDPRIKIVNMSRRFGVAPCTIAGFRYASGDAIVYMDSDLQDPPELIPKLVEKWKDGYDVVHTTRTKRRGENYFKMLLTRIAYRAINMVSEIDIPMNTGDFKLLSRRAMNEVLRLKEYDPFLRGLSRWVGFKQVQVTYERDARFAGETHYSLFRSLNPVKEFIRGLTSYSEVPLYFALVVGFFVSIAAFIYLFYIFFSRYFLGMHLPGWPAMMVTMLFLGGTILFTIGVLGLYIGKIYQEIKKRPQFIVESTLGLEAPYKDDEDNEGC